MAWFAESVMGPRESRDQVPAWELVDAADQAAGWLVEPAVTGSRLELLTASLQLSQAAQLVVDRDAAGRPHVASPSSDESLDGLCRELAEVVAAARDQVIQESSGSGAIDTVAGGEAALLLDQAHRTIKETMS